MARLDELRGFVPEWRPPFITPAAVLALIPAQPPGTQDKLLDALAHKTILVHLKKLLDETPALNQRFAASTGWQLLNQILTATRVRELASVRIVKKGGRGGLRFDVSELVKSYYGKQILAGLKFNVARRRVVDKAEFQTIVDALKTIKLTLPEAVEPTTTEKFFADPSDRSPVDRSAGDAVEPQPKEKK